MDGRPSVTVIVPTRNRSSYLGDCLASLARQRPREPFEVLVVDNGSTDDTPAVIDRWCRQDRRFRVAREPRVGLSRAKNAGISQAEGRILLFTDDDSIVEDGWIESYLGLLAEREGTLVMAGGPVVPIPHDLGAWPRWFDRPALPDLGLLDYQGERQLRRFEYVWGGNMAVPASLFAQVGPWDEAIGRRADERGTFEDAEFQDRVRAAGGDVLFCPGAVVRHRLARSAITPRRVLSTAFARGRNERAQRSLLGAGGPGGAETGGGGTWRRLGTGLGGWVWWAAVFRSRGTREALERARLAAWSSGWSLDDLRAGHEAASWSRLVARAVFAVRGLALRIASGRPTR